MKYIVKMDLNIMNEGPSGKVVKLTMKKELDFSPLGLEGFRFTPSISVQIEFVQYNLLTNQFEITLEGLYAYGDNKIFNIYVKDYQGIGFKKVKE